MENTLRRINALKWAFKHYLSAEFNFNYSKWYVISYWIDFIRRFNSADNFDFIYFEAAYIYYVKVFYKLTNKRDDYKL
jgi:hypothetical protein